MGPRLLVGAYGYATYAIQVQCRHNDVQVCYSILGFALFTFRFAKVTQDVLKIFTNNILNDYQEEQSCKI